MRSVLLLFCVASFLRPVVAAGQSPAERDAAAAIEAIESALVDVIARVEPSVVAISRASPRDVPTAMQEPGPRFGEFRQPTSPDREAVVGAGVIIDGSGLVLTQYLAVREGEQHLVTTVEGHRYPATILGADPRSGLAVLKVEPTASPAPRSTGGSGTASGQFPAIRFGDASTLRKGQIVVAVGNPFAIVSDGQATASWGVVTNLAQKAPPGTNLNNAPGSHNDHRTSMHHLGTLIQTDARLGWSAGGAALVNRRGELVGVTTTAAVIAGHEQPAGYAIPMNTLIRRVIDALKQGREVEYGMLGVGFGQSIIESAAGSERRLNVAQVYAGSPADRAGLRVGDVITRVDGKEISDVDAMQLAISALPPATVTTIEYERRGRPATATVAVAKLAVAGHPIVTHRGDAWRGLRVDYATALDAAELEQAIASGALDAEGCVLVKEVERESEAWRAGVRAGMFISHVGGRRVATPREFRAAARQLEGEQLDLRLTQPAAPDDEEARARPENPR